MRGNTLRPNGWKPNPQALADLKAVSRDSFTGSALLQSHEADGDTWLTPRYVLDCLGSFDLDPCAAQSNATWAAPRYFTRADDGLSQEWSGRVWCNPPFSDVRPWIEASAKHTSGILLVTASIESRIWKDVVWRRATAVLLLHGRTRFCRPDGSATVGRPLRSIALVAWSAEDAVTLEAAPLAGVLLKSWQQR
jgi:phage N-6-adenine-methyltransferase